MKESIADIFQDEFNWMQREMKGLYPWVDKNRWEFIERITGGMCDHPFCHRHRGNGRNLISSLVSSQLQHNPLLDVFQKAILRAEIRFISRFILQRSNEERLTGNLVSELDAAIFLAKPIFKNLSKERYNTEQNFDFFYYDLSRGGKVEKQTGADLGFVVVVDLPDHPFMVRSVVFQAKKCDSSASIDIAQLRKIQETTDNKSAYLFYDMDFRSLASPIVIDTSKLTSQADESEKKGAKSFTLKKDDILGRGVPLSLYMLHDVIEGGQGMEFSSFKSAFRRFEEMTNSNVSEPFNGRLAIVSLGKPISISSNLDGGLDLSI
ncbi:MAG: hypothetical protein KKD92_03295 [Proteobacteria bacterium]|nr:hypothetical protein [Pseudomonadota bacterium]